MYFYTCVQAMGSKGIRFCLVNRQPWAIQVGGWKTNSDPVIEQSTLLTTEPSLKLQKQGFYLEILNILIQEIALKAPNILTVSPL